MGGGLLMGILQGLDEVGWTPPVVACETVGASSMAQSLAAGSLVTLPGIASVAKSLGAATVGKAIFERCLALGPRVVPWTMNDAAAVRACALFAIDHRILWNLLAAQPWPQSTREAQHFRARNVWL